MVRRSRLKKPKPKQQKFKARRSPALANASPAENKQPPKQAEQFIARITASWNRQVETILETGRLLLQAKDELPHGQFTEMIGQWLPFGSRTAQRLMAIAEHPVLSKPTHVSHLPRSWGTLYEMTELPEEELEAMLEDGRIDSGTQRKDIEKLQKELREDALYNWEMTASLISKLVKFQQRWPTPTTIAGNIFDEMSEGIYAMDFNELPALASWISELHASLKKIDDENKADDDAQDRAEVADAAA